MRYLLALLLLLTSSIGFANQTELAQQLSQLPQKRLERMRAAAANLREVTTCFEGGQQGMLQELLQGRIKVQERHFPDGEVCDAKNHCQYYYHSHRPDEHGHFHLFLQKDVFPEESEPDYVPSYHSRYAHLMAISVDDNGEPIAIFSVNQWVTGELWYNSEVMIPAIDHFVIEEEYPSREMNMWLTSFVELFQPQIAQLLQQRDEALWAWQEAHPDTSVFEANDFEIVAVVPISINEQLAAIDAID